MIILAKQSPSVRRAIRSWAFLGHDFTIMKGLGTRGPPLSIRWSAPPAWLQASTATRKSTTLESKSRRMAHKCWRALEKATLRLCVRVLSVPPTVCVYVGAGLQAVIAVRPSAQSPAAQPYRRCDPGCFKTDLEHPEGRTAQKDKRRKQDTSLTLALVMLSQPALAQDTLSYQGSISMRPPAGQASYPIVFSLIPNATVVSSFGVRPRQRRHRRWHV